MPRKVRTAYERSPKALRLPIPSLREPGSLRAKFCEQIRHARKGKTVHGTKYTYYGTERDWKKALRHETLYDIESRLGRGKKVRFLDVGPGKGKYLGRFAKEMDNVEVHSLSPENINPKWKKPRLKIPGKKRRLVRNRNYVGNWHHHVGAAETYDFNKLIAKNGEGFDVIHSDTAVATHSISPEQTVVRLAKLLNPGGKAFFFLDFYHIGRQKNIVTDFARLLKWLYFYPEFDVDTGYNHISVERKK